jgi:cysteine desulfurase
MTERFFYLDYNATTPPDPEVGRAMEPFLTGFFGNPSSTHRAGREAHRHIARARQSIADCIGAAAEEIVFTSGGTEANNLALRGVLSAARGGHVITSGVEHPAILEVVLELDARREIELTVVGVDSVGRVAPESVEAAIRPDTRLVSVMLANNEVGTIQPIRKISEVCGKRGVLLHTDAAQAVGKIPVAVDELGVDLLSIAGHKLYAPKGVGALYVRRGTPIAPVMFGAGHERGLRPGTENVLEAVGLGVACRIVSRRLAVDMEHSADLRMLLERKLRAGIVDLVVHGDAENKLPNTLSVALPGVEATELLARLENEVAASAGAACHSGGDAMSHVLVAMGVPRELARCTVRFSVGRFSTADDVEQAAARVLAEARTLKRSGAR